VLQNLFQHLNNYQSFCPSPIQPFISGRSKKKSLFKFRGKETPLMILVFFIFLIQLKKQQLVKKSFLHNNTAEEDA
jgi:hypothetical protein